MKKILAMLMALMLLVLPFGGMAEDAVNDYYTKALESGRRVTTTMYVGEVAPSFTGEAAIDQIINDLLNAVNVTAYEQNEELYFSLGMKQEATGAIADLLTFGAASKDGVGYVSSNLLGGTIAVSMDEVEPLVLRLVDMFELAGFITENDAKMIREEMPAIFDQFEAELKNAMTTAVAEVDVFSLDYSAFTDVLKPIIDRVEKTDVAMQPRNCDPAASVVNVTITGAELEELLVACIRFIQANPALLTEFQAGFEAAMAETGETASFEEQLEQAVAEMQEDIDIKGDAVISLYLDEKDEPVYMLATLPEMESGDSVAENAVVPTVTYTRMTMNDSVAYSFVANAGQTDVTLNVIDKGVNVAVNFAVANEGATVFAMNLEATDRSAENLIAMDMNINMTIVDDSQYDYEYNAETGDWDMIQLDPVTTEIALKIVSDTALNGVDFDSRNAFTIGVNGKEYCTIHVDYVSGEAGPSIMDGEVIRPAALSDADFANWFVSVFNGLQSWIYTVVQALPASVLNMMM